MSSRQQKHGQMEAGFTLLELMIVVAIIGIISAIAIPAYQGYIEAANRASLQANIDSLRLFLEDYYLENDTYIAGSYAGGNPAASTITGPLSWTPQGDGAKFDYLIEACGAGTIANCYKITATHFDGTTQHVFEKTP